MKKITFTSIFISVLMFLSFHVSSATPEVPKNKSGAAAAWSEDGLQKISVKGLDVVYARPGANLADYNKVLLRPISVAFRRSWEKSPMPGSKIRMSAKDSQRIRDKLAALVNEEVVKQLTAGGYQLVNEAGDDVLEVNISIVDLSIAAPDVSTSNSVTTYALSAGEMTLIADLRDSASGDIVMRVFDHTKGHESPWAKRITSIDNAAEARSIASAWAQALREGLDVARTVNKP